MTAESPELPLRDELARLLLNCVVGGLLFITLAAAVTAVDRLRAAIPSRV